VVVTHYNYFRDYDPTIGRYIQSDPIGLNGDASAYSYARSAALLFSDLQGLEAYAPPLPGFQIPERPWRVPWQGIAEGLGARCLGAIALLLYSSDAGSICNDDPRRQKEECRDKDPCDKLLTQYEIKRLGRILDSEQRGFTVERLKEQLGCRPAARCDLYKCRDGRIVMKGKGDSLSPGQDTRYNVNDPVP